MKFDKYPATLVVGPSGTGKSTSIENLDPAKTCIFNVEGKALPFKKANEFKYHAVIDPNQPLKLIGKMRGLLDQKHNYIEVVVVEGFDKWSQLLLEWTTAETKNHKNRFERYSMHNFWILEFFKLLKELKSSGRYVFVIGHDDIVETHSGSTFRAMSVNGQQWSGKCEREVEMVLFTEVERRDNENHYYFQTQSDGDTTAKTPKGMFDEYRIENDLAKVLQGIQNYYS
jgi:hypothetical protein